MRKISQTSDNMRKIPSQDRSRFTIEAILDATAQLLDAGPFSGVTTNHIAQRAGVSIGTLYQYFPNKSAVLTALADRGRQARVEEVMRQLATVEAGTIEDVTRQIIRMLITVFAKSRGDRQLTILMVLRRLETPRENLPVDGVASMIANKVNALQNLSKSQSEVMSFILTRSIIGTIRTAVMDAPHLLENPEFEDQLVRLATGFLQAP
jgi:AcrR family transcriptional regulator